MNPVLNPRCPIAHSVLETRCTIGGRVADKAGVMRRDESSYASGQAGQVELRNGIKDNTLSSEADGGGSDSARSISRPSQAIRLIGEEVDRIE